MVKTETISVFVTPAPADFLASCVESGRYQSTSEAVREGVRLLEQQSRVRAAEIAHIQDRIAARVADLEAGRVMDAASFFTEWNDELDGIEESQRA
ncbi:MAG: type II toxin-antitoxin system ParD family antitoxin [Rhodobacteraceae bacterium]|nr:type II toxin-antitoxin system ParD family antitoxin [Paracoccaceae bacterium]MCY4196710.1 type II toxin-antitoxin system ParD family antitoxin [Paracoccaceae bacterium]MCY4326620.1 type II toxin-antitoxin system ParD family antitoxin [Paracoccaceae bacterium]